MYVVHCCVSLYLQCRTLQKIYNSICHIQIPELFYAIRGIFSDLYCWSTYTTQLTVRFYHVELNAALWLEMHHAFQTDRSLFVLMFVSILALHYYRNMGSLPDIQNCGLRMRRECRERFPRHRLQRKQVASDPGMHHGTCVTQVPWCMSGSLSRCGGENVPGIPGACASRNFVYLADRDQL